MTANEDDLDDVDLDNEDDWEDDDDDRPHSRRHSSRDEGDATGGIIPYKNPSALIAYYCGIFSLLPVLGLFLGLAGLILGIRGLKYRAAHPEAKGSVHAWIGIIMGGLFTLIWGGLIVIMIIGVMTDR